MVTEARSSCRKEPPRMRRRHGRSTFGSSSGRLRLGRHSGVCMAVFSSLVRKGHQTKKRRMARRALHLGAVSQFTIVRLTILPRASVRVPSVVLVRCYDRLLPLRRMQQEPMLRKGNVLDCANRGTFCIVLTDNHVQEPSAPHAAAVSCRIMGACLIYFQQG